MGKGFILNTFQKIRILFKKMSWKSFCPPKTTSPYFLTRLWSVIQIAGAPSPNTSSQFRSPVTSLAKGVLAVIQPSLEAYLKGNTTCTGSLRHLSKSLQGVRKSLYPLHQGDVYPYTTGYYGFYNLYYETVAAICIV